MPIFIPGRNPAQPDPVLPAFAAVQACGDHEVHLALDPNEAGSGCGKQSDRAAASELPAAFTAEQTGEWVKNLTQAAIDATHKKANDITAKKATDTMAELDKNEDTFESKGYNSGSSWTLAAFHPDSERIYLSSLSDSLAFVVLSDGKKPPELLRISYGFDINPDRNKGVMNYLGASDAALKKGKISIAHPPVFCSDQAMNFTRNAIRKTNEFSEASKQEKANECASGYITLEQMRQEAMKRGFDTKRLSLTLVVASDGVSKLSPAQLSAVAAGDAPNRARAMIDESLLAQGKDNMASIVIPLAKNGQLVGKQPVAACVADGFGEDGHIIADTAIEQFQRSMERLNHFGGLPNPDKAVMRNR